jgi:hypothetical protein
MRKSFLAVFAGLLFAGALSFLAAADAKTGTWKGIVTDQMCAQKGVKLDDADCAAKCVGMGSKYALYDASTKKVYVLNPQDQAAKHAGHTVTVKGSMDGDTITAQSITMPAAKKD